MVNFYFSLNTVYRLSVHPRLRAPIKMMIIEVREGAFVAENKIE